ncbi:MAG TPA: glycosyltransferase family 4 protein [Actinomycetota bacterium]|nr:glycosyltransferase family 4 protein [Actinomycetota bacterium]
MKILHTVQLYDPLKGGSEEVVKQISERLAARGHEVVVATARSSRRTFSSLNGVTVEEFNLSGNEVFGIKGDPNPYREFVKSWDGDLMLNYGAGVWSTDILLDHLSELTFRKLLVPCGYWGLGDPRFASYYRTLPSRIENYDSLIYMSKNYQDYHFDKQNGLEHKAVVIPNGAAEDEFSTNPFSFRKRYEIKTPFMVLTVSNHHKAKGHRHLIRAMRGIGDATLVIVGEPALPDRPWIGCYARCKAVSAVSGKVMALRGVPRQDVIAAYKDADLFALGSEVECAPLVIYESMAAGTPFVSTRCGNVADNEEHGVVVDHPSQLGATISSLLLDPTRRKQLGESGHRAWLESYTWEKITDRYEGLYAQLAGQK